MNGEQDAAAFDAPFVARGYIFGNSHPDVELRPGLPTVAPTPTPLNMAMIGRAAINGPNPGMASIPIPASHPSVPPITAPDVAPAAAPSGAFVPFSRAKSFVPSFWGKRTEMSAFRKPSRFIASTAVSTCVLVEKIPKTTEFAILFLSSYAIVSDYFEDGCAQLHTPDREQLSIPAPLWASMILIFRKGAMMNLKTIAGRYDVLFRTADERLFGTGKATENIATNPTSSE